jgi:hypothetical protein
MKTRIIFLSVLACFIGGCASWQGQVALTRYTPLGASSPGVPPSTTNSPVAIPKATNAVDSTSAVGVGGNAASNGGYMPILGEIIIGDKNLELQTNSRSWFYWKDPANYITANPLPAPYASGDAEGVISPVGVTLQNSAGLTITAGTNGIPISGGKSITLQIAASHNVSLSNLREIKLNMLNFDYIRSFPDIDGDGENVYFISQVVAADLSGKNDIGVTVGYNPPAEMVNGDNPTIKAAYDDDYQGYGLILGAIFSKMVQVAGFTNFTQESIDALNNSAGAKAARILSTPQALKLEHFKNTLMTEIGVDITAVPYLTNVVNNKLEVTFKTGNLFSPNSQISDGTNRVASNVIDLAPGDHLVTYIGVSANKLYAIQCDLSVSDQLGLQEDVQSRISRYLEWNAVSF